MRVLIACEFSGVVRDAFRALGHDAVSADLLPSERPGPHIRGDVLDVLSDGWDVVIAHPPCTYLSKAGAWRWPRVRDEQAAAIAFVRALYDAPIPRVAIENPPGALSRLWRPPSQYVDLWWFGAEQRKRTGLWLRGLPPLLASDVRQPPLARHKGQSWITDLPPSPERWMARSRTDPHLAAAMAAQWGGLVRANEEAA